MYHTNACANLGLPMPALLFYRCPVQTLIAAVRCACSAAVWSRGVELSRSGADHEFSAEILLCCSDVEALGMAELVTLEKQHNPTLPSVLQRLGDQVWSYTQTNPCLASNM